MTMKNLLAVFAALVSLNAHAELKPGDSAPGCNVEAHNFAEATDRYKVPGASVIGVSNDPIDTLQRFSVSECRGKFPVAADTDGAIMKAYDAVMPVFSGYASRTSYVIAPDGKIIYVHSSMSPDKHVENTLAAVKKWKDERR
jgi:peroxiredoxin